MKTIARTLNEQKRKTPALMQLELLNKSLPNTQDVILKKYLWDATMIARILRDESYVGTLICHKSERNKINKTFRITEPEEQFRHENYLPPIITPELWEQTQMMLAERKRLNVRAAPSQEILRYSGLLRCEDCGRAMFGKRIHLKNGERIVYVCSTYNRYGKEHCSQHQIDEAVLDKLIMDELRNTKRLYQQNWDALEQLIAQWTPKAELTGAQIIKLEKKIRCLEDETEAILMERMIGVRGLMNDYYAKDIGKKIRAGYRQKQKDGLVITPPFGYWKDKNTNQVLVQQEAAETVQLIYSLYLQGCGQKEIARRLNGLGRKTPAQIMTERIGYDSQKPHKTRDGQFLWTYASVKNVLVEEAYTGVLVNHRREYLGGKVRLVNETDWLRHENFYPVIIEKTIWQKVQTRLKQQARPAVNNRTKHRYAGLLTCQECGNVFSPMIRYWNGSRRVEYVCRGYQRNGKGYCGSHRIHEEVLDKAVWNHAKKLREQYAAELKKVTQLQKQWALRKPVLDAHCLTLQKEILRLEQEIDELVMEKLNCDRHSSAHEIGT